MYVTVQEIAKQAVQYNGFALSIPNRAGKAELIGSSTNEQKVRIIGSDRVSGGASWIVFHSLI
jgi:hypothetical protein